MSSQRGFAPPLGHHLQELHLDLTRSPSSINLPHSIVSCTALVSLTLKGSIHVEKHSSIHLPSLKNLKMHTYDVGHMDRLFSRCPALETLKLTFAGGNGPKIRMPSSLKSLTFKNYCCYIDDLEINTPFLEYLDIELVATCLRFSVSNLPNVVEAHLELMHEFYRALPMLLRALCRTKLLELKCVLIEVLCLSKSYNPLTKC